MHRIFLVFDVLREVSCYQETNDLAAVVGVSRAWYGAAIPLLWRKVDFSVLKMFGKMLESETQWKFVHFLPERGAEFSSTLARFLLYAVHVREFNISPIEDQMSLNLTAGRQFERVIPYEGKPLFPNLRVLKITGDCAFRQLMGPEVTDLTWLFEVDDPINAEDVRSISQSMAKMMPKIETVTLEGGWTIIEYEEIFLEFLCSLPQLRHVCLPRFVLTPFLFDGLAAVAGLQGILLNEMDNDFEQAMLGRRPVLLRWSASMRWPSSPAYSNLQSLELSLPFIAVATSFFGTTPFPAPRLEALELWIGFSQGTTSATVALFFRTLHGSCPNMTDICLCMHVESSNARDVLGIDPLDCSALLPLQAFTRLVSFCMEHTVPLVLSDDDVARLAHGWTQMEVLSLNRHPLLLLKPKTTIASLLHLARLCPRLNVLGLYVDTDVYIDVPKDVCFRQDLALDVGVSPFPTPPSAEGLWIIAEFFARVMNEGSRIITGANDVMFDSVEFCPALVMGGFSRARDTGQMDRFREGWETVDSMSKSFRRWMKRLDNGS